MVLSATIAALAYVSLGNESLLQHLLSGAGATGFFWSLYLLTRGKGMGLGDVKLAFPIGLFLGGVNTLICIYLAFLTGAAVSIILILLRLKNRKDKIAFGPFLVSATLMSIIWGKNLHQLYTHLFQ
jgi:leader peptidase (prepilin peptidase)/N-methyltransferase